MRKNKIVIVGGQQGVGKSYRTLQELKEYVRPGKSGRAGRNVVIFDVNGEDDYRAFKKIPYNPTKGTREERSKYIAAFAAQEKKEIRRISCITSTGRGFTLAEKQQCVIDLLNVFRNGLILLEDINAYFINMSQTELISTLINVRHRGLDVIIHLQSLRMVRPVLWQNGALIRMHKQTDPIDKYADRLTNFPLVKIAQIIVDREFARGNQRFFLYVDSEAAKIIGVTGVQFAEAAKNFLAEYPKEMKGLKARTNLSGQALLNKWIEENKTMWA